MLLDELLLKGLALGFILFDLLVPEFVAALELLLEIFLKIFLFALVVLSELDKLPSLKLLTKLGKLLLCPGGLDEVSSFLVLDSLLVESRADVRGKTLTLSRKSRFPCCLAGRCSPSRSSAYPLAARIGGSPRSHPAGTVATPRFPLLKIFIINKRRHN